MAKILSRVLKGLERIYVFPGSQKGAPNDLELDLPIQVVHDVSENSVMGASLGPMEGFWIQTDQHTHVGVGMIQTTPIPWASGNALNMFPAVVPADRFQCWLMAGAAYCDDGTDLAAILMGWTPSDRALGPNNIAPGYSVCFPYFYSTTNHSVKVLKSTSGDGPLPVPLASPDQAIGGVYTQSFLNNDSVSDNLGTMIVRFNSLLWYGPKGCRPPR